MTSTGPGRRPANFDFVARLYRWVEYLTLGRALEQCRFALLPRVGGRERALVLGDGDGRALALLLDASPRLQADAVDASAVMLSLLRSRCRAAVAEGRLRTFCEPAGAFVAQMSAAPLRYDLVVTHFFLDCLEQPEVETLVLDAVAAMTADGVWLVSEFRIPESRLRSLAKVLVGGLYFAFGVLTGLRVTELPDHAGAMRAAGLERVEQRLSLGGILATEIWRRVG